LSFNKVLKISRPRFWVYLLGPFLVGFATVYPDFSNLYLLIIFGFYFTLPANLLVYGINDIFDYETDKKNPKKEDYEAKVKPQQRNKLYTIIALTNLPFLPLLYWLPYSAIISLGLFLFFSIFYSAKPIRAKTIPFLDSLFNILYLFPGYVGYFLAGGSSFNLKIFLAGTCWVMAMHAYSAVPDIEADKQSGIETVATKLGGQNTLIFCLLLYIASAGLAYFKLGSLSLIFGLIYTGLMFFSLYKFKEDQLFRVYRYFPLVNILIGFLIFVNLI
jgi:4-hydroxybenzoate polyprenyltransferase